MNSKILLNPVIVARSGSSLKNKNIAIDKKTGLPLLGLAIKKCLTAYSGLPDVSRPVVLTDSIKYADISETMGAEVPFITVRTPDLEDVTVKLYNWILTTALTNSWVLVVQCTSPDLSVETLKCFYDSLKSRSDLKSNEVWISCIPERKKFTGLFFDKGDNVLEQAIDKFGYISPSVPRQVLPKALRFSGACTMVHTSQLTKPTLFDGSIIHSIMHVNESEGIDIDSEADLDKAGVQLYEE